MEIISDWIITERLDSSRHVEVLIDIHFEPTFHLLIVDLVFLPCELFLVDVYHLKIRGFF